MTGTAAPEATPQQFTFEQMNLQVGMRLQVITHRALRPAQNFSNVIGWVKDEYLIIKIPFEQGAPIALGEGDKLTLRVFSGVNVCSFNAIVERIFGRPLLYAHVTFPKQIQGTSLRMAMRVKVDIPAQVKTAAGFEQVGFLVNLSVSGALMHTKKPIPEEVEPVAVQFTLLTEPDKRQVIITAKASIRNVNAAEPWPDGRPRYAYGMQFIDLDPAHYMMLQNLTYQALITDRQKIV
ncbi:flagellar brake protein [Pseudoduganella sp. SL102]|uniref:flagellar brake protein n=1 Tax=Pseudoduganella sp. SL102 TaxID=2995154 RepID=UPI00248B3892|nr:flagellar brake protein [Pseudoduganella sp. SL102]WBS02460.1 flagellar brake protein [Pseudoduganella sp. SL102]